MDYDWLLLAVMNIIGFQTSYLSVEKTFGIKFYSGASVQDNVLSFPAGNLVLLVHYDVSPEYRRTNYDSCSRWRNVCLAIGNGTYHMLIGSSSTKCSLFKLFNRNHYQRVVLHTCSYSGIVTHNQCPRNPDSGAECSSAYRSSNGISLIMQPCVAYCNGNAKCVPAHAHETP